MNREYKKPESDVKIFTEKVNFDKGPVVDTVNRDYKKPESDIKVRIKKLFFGSIKMKNSVINFNKRFLIKN